MCIWRDGVLVHGDLGSNARASHACSKSCTIIVCRRTRSVQCSGCKAFLLQVMESSVPGINTGTKGSTASTSSSIWLPKETVTLIEIWRQSDIQWSLNCRPSGHSTWQHISDRMFHFGYVRTAAQCRRKLIRLLSRYAAAYRDQTLLHSRSNAEFLSVAALINHTVRSSERRFSTDFRLVYNIKERCRRRSSRGVAVTSECSLTLSGSDATSPGGNRCVFSTIGLLHSPTTSMSSSSSICFNINGSSYTVASTVPENLHIRAGEEESNVCRVSTVADSRPPLQTDTVSVSASEWSTAASDEVNTASTTVRNGEVPVDLTYPVSASTNTGVNSCTGGLLPNTIESADDCSTPSLAQSDCQPLPSGTLPVIDSNVPYLSIPFLSSVPLVLGSDGVYPVFLSEPLMQRRHAAQTDDTILTVDAPPSCNYSVSSSASVYNQPSTSTSTLSTPVTTAFSAREGMFSSLHSKPGHSLLDGQHYPRVSSLPVCTWNVLSHHLYTPASHDHTK